MEAGIIALPFFLFFFYILPIWLACYKSISKTIRLILVLIPVSFTLLVVSIAVYQNYKYEQFDKQFPQANKITFKDSPLAVHDSISQLQQRLAKLPKRLDYKSVSYSLDKYPKRYNNFSFNLFEFGNLNYLEDGNNFRSIEISQPDLRFWKTINGPDIKPFDTLNENEAKRFINLIKYLDRNSLSAANLEDGIISFEYQDSLLKSAEMGSRIIAFDTTGRFGFKTYDLIDAKNGFYLLQHKD